MMIIPLRRNMFCVKTSWSHVTFRNPIDVLKTEGRLLHNLRLGQCYTKHILKMYKQAFVERRLGMNVRFDPPPNGPREETWEGWEISIGLFKISDCLWFLFFLQFRLWGKDAHFCDRKYNAQNPVPEELVWMLFRCLALGCVVMDFGNEGLIGVKWNGF